jgi:hypothetical protein
VSAGASASPAGLTARPGQRPGPKCARQTSAVATYGSSSLDGRMQKNRVVTEPQGAQVGGRILGAATPQLREMDLAEASFALS